METVTQGDDAEPRYCVWHPAVETLVSCGRCGRPICTRCMIYTPVGVRCRDCAQMRRLPQYVLGPREYARVIPAAIALAMVLGFVLSFVPGVGSFIGGIVVGILVAAGLRRASGYRQGREMEVVGGATVVLTIVLSVVFSVLRAIGIAHIGVALRVALAPQLLGANALGIIIGIYIVVQRLR